MKPIEHATVELAKIDQIPDDARPTMAEYKRLRREVVRLEYLLATIDDHLCSMIRLGTSLKAVPLNLIQVGGALDALVKAKQGRGE